MDTEQLYNLILRCVRDARSHY